MNGTGREGYTFKEFEDAVARLVGNPPVRVPTADEILAEIVRVRVEAQIEEHREREREERERELDTVAQVKFHGHAKAYCYRVYGGFEVGDYLRVWSPHTEREEIVRVTGRGLNAMMRHRTPDELKMAHPLSTHDPLGRLRLKPGACVRWEV